ncbi:unknown [Klebsiella variicola CAG:634]|nr:unknown [Klebsiella variicola CAG:634]
MLLGAGKKFMFAEGDMILAARVKRAGNVTMGHQQLRVLALAQRRQQAVFTGARGAHQPNQFSRH